MSADSFEFERNEGAFTGRQHIVNHVDMILGLGSDFHSSFRKGRLVHACDTKHGIDYTTSVAKLAENELSDGRNWLLGQCAYAMRWEQLLPIRGGYYLDPTDFHTLDDGLRVLGACESEWIERDYDGDRDAFWAETPVVVLLAFWDCATCDRIVVRKRPSSDEEIPPVPVNDRSVMAKRHGDSEAWHTFAERICANDYIKKKLAERQGGVCAICGSALGKTVVVHHVDYDHECGLAQVDSDWTRLGSRVQPDCEKCHANHAELFDGCSSRLRAVHMGCNYLIEGTL
ncbi:MAG: hypothetical protein IKF78_06015 [Atopobiaceae bacterium]|nr:hypothetical protein [Atopobiaceae bacterium]